MTPESVLRAKPRLDQAKNAPLDKWAVIEATANYFPLWKPESVEVFADMVANGEKEHLSIQMNALSISRAYTAGQQSRDARIAELESALHIYADAKNWNGYPGFRKFIAAIDGDGFEVARHALTSEAHGS